MSGSELLLVAPEIAEDGAVVPLSVTTTGAVVLVT